MAAFPGGIPFPVAFSPLSLADGVRVAMEPLVHLVAARRSRLGPLEAPENSNNRVLSGKIHVSSLDLAQNRPPNLNLPAEDRLLGKWAEKTDIGQRFPR